MNGPLKMYRMKPIVLHDFPVDLPTCMYRMKNIHAARNTNTADIAAEQRIGDQSATSSRKLNILDQNNQNNRGMAALEARQDEILKQLANLKKQMDSIRTNLNQTKNEPSTTPVVLCSPAPIPTIPDIVIKTSPTHPPYSLQIIQKLWKNYLSLTVTCHTHSTIDNLCDQAKQLASNLESFSPEKGVPQVNVMLIWKNVGANTELILSQRPISGETNILRYLSRVSSPTLNYETYSNVFEIDSLLDTSYLIANSKSKTERITLLQALNKSLGKNTWLGGRNQISIADLAAFSAIKQVTNSNEINVNLSKWLQRCEAY